MLLAAVSSRLLVLFLCTWLCGSSYAFFFGLLDSVAVVNLIYLAAERTAELSKNSMHEYVCRVAPHTFLWWFTSRDTNPVIKSPTPDAEELSRPHVWRMAFSILLGSHFLPWQGHKPKFHPKSFPWATAPSVSTLEGAGNEGRRSSTAAGIRKLVAAMLHWYATFPFCSGSPVHNTADGKRGSERGCNFTQFDCRE